MTLPSSVIAIPVVVEPPPAIDVSSVQPAVGEQLPPAEYVAVPRTPPTETTHELANVVVILCVIGDVDPVFVLLVAPRESTPEYSVNAQELRELVVHDIVKVVAPDLTLWATQRYVTPVAPLLATFPIAV